MMKWPMVMDVKVERGSKSCALLVQDLEPREQTPDCNQVLNLGGWGGLLYGSTDGLFY